MFNKVSSEESIEGVRNGEKLLWGRLADRLRVRGMKRWSDPGQRRESIGNEESARERGRECKRIEETGEKESALSSSLSRVCPAYWYLCWMDLEKEGAIAWELERNCVSYQASGLRLIWIDHWGKIFEYSQDWFLLKTGNNSRATELIYRHNKSDNKGERKTSRKWLWMSQIFIELSHAMTLYR